jgi:hypothetical protein
MVTVKNYIQYQTCVFSSDSNYLTVTEMFQEPELNM